MDSLKEIFHPDALGALVTRYAEHADEKSFIGVYEAGEPIEASVDGTFKYEQLSYSRDLAAITHIDSPSVGTKKLLQIPKTGSCIAIKEHVDLPARFLESWRAPGQNMPNAAAQIANNLKNLTNRVQRTLNYLAGKSLLTTNGTIDLSTVPNSQIAGSLVFPVQALTAATTWATDTTKIRSAELPRLWDTYRTVGPGFRPREVIASKDIEKYLTQNVEVSNFFRDGGLAGQILARNFEASANGQGGPIDFGQLMWQFVEDFYATDASPDTAVKVNSAANKMAVLPDRSRWSDCFAFVTGVQFLPTAPEGVPLPIGTPYQARRGFGAYVTQTLDPVGLRLHVFWTGMIVQKMPKAVMVFNATS